MENRISRNAEKAGRKEGKTAYKVTVLFGTKDLNECLEEAVEQIVNPQKEKLLVG